MRGILRLVLLTIAATLVGAPSAFATGALNYEVDPEDPQGTVYLTFRAADGGSNASSVSRTTARGRRSPNRRSARPPHNARPRASASSTARSRTAACT